MTELQIGLIGLGAVAVVSVFAYNKWQEHRHRKVAEQVLRADHDDVLLTGGQQSPPKPRESDAPVKPTISDEMPPVILPAAGERREPVLGDLPGDDEQLPRIPLPDEVVPVETVLPPLSDATPGDVAAKAPFADSSDDEPVPPAGEVPNSLVDPRVDYIVVMELVEPEAVDDILFAQRDALRRIGKPVIWVGFNERTREWETMVAGSERAYRRLRIALQLADRRGPLSEADLTVFVAAVQGLADDLMAVADMPAHQGVLEQAVALDRFCADVDLEIGVHLISRGTPFAGTKVRSLAEAAGMTLMPDGSFTRFDDDGRAQFKLQNFEDNPFTAEAMRSLTTHGLTFLLDVPRVDHGEPVFFKMLDNAKRFAEHLQGQLVDDNRQPLNDAQLDNIRRQYVVKPQLAMQTFGLPAGSPQALRLFS